MLRVVEGLGHMAQLPPVLGRVEPTKTTAKASSKSIPSDDRERLARLRSRCKTCSGKSCIGRCRF